MRYFIYADNRQQGPFSVSELMERGLSSETLVWAEGMEQWTPAWQVRELKDAMEGKAQPGPVPPPLPSEPSARAESASGQADGGRDYRTDASGSAAYSAGQGGGSGTSGMADAAEEIIYEPRRRHIGGRVAV